MFPSIFAIALLLHGLGHAVFAANAWGIAHFRLSHGAPAEPTVADTRLAKGIFSALWLLPLAGFLGSAWAFYHGVEGWQTQLLACSLLSSLMVVLWRRDIHATGALFAPAFNLFVIALVYWQGQNTLILG